MVLLRPHLGSADELVARITRQRDAGYRLLALWRADTPVALAGYHFEENLIHGKFVYVDDLVTAADERRGGLGARLLHAVAMIGRDAGCGRLVLATALDNVLAHRFYYRQGMLARACASAARLRRNDASAMKMILQILVSARARKPGAGEPPATSWAGSRRCALVPA
jgi:GNAT superfamily N-acetyltransferase